MAQDRSRTAARRGWVAKRKRPIPQPAHPRQKSAFGFATRACVACCRPKRGFGGGKRHRGGRVRRCGWSLAGALLSFFEPTYDQQQRQRINEEAGKLGA